MNEHDGRLVDRRHGVPPDSLSILEGIARHPLGSLVGDELDGLHDAGDDLVLDARVLSLGVFADDDRVDAVVGRLEAFDRPTRPDVGEEVEGPSEGQVKRDVAFANGRGQRSLQRQGVSSDAVQGVLRDLRLAVDDGRGDVDGFPGDGHAGLGEDVLDGLRDLGTNAVACQRVISRDSGGRRQGGPSMKETMKLPCVKINS
jgi:hypothetical protein